MYAGPELAKRCAYGERGWFDNRYGARSLDNVYIVEEVVNYVKRK